MTEKELDEKFKASLLKCRLIFMKNCLLKNPKAGEMAREFAEFKRLLRMKLGLPPDEEERDTYDDIRQANHNNSRK